MFLIFVRVNFCEEICFTYFVKIKFSELYKKNILPVAVTFCMTLKKGVNKVSQRPDLH